MGYEDASIEAKYRADTGELVDGFPVPVYARPIIDGRRVQCVPVVIAYVTHRGRNGSVREQDSGLQVGCDRE